VSRELSQALAHDLTTSKRRVLGTDRTIIQQYFAAHQVRKLHLGAGGNRLDGWLNSDYFPKVEGVLHLDARGRFPFADAQFDYVFSEHMIEHLAFAKGAAMLKECHRVLKPGGRVRISTPALEFLVALADEDRLPVQSAYIEWATQKFVKTAPYPDAAFVINNFVRRWGHLFIYDEKTLRRAFADAGFVDITRCELNESIDPALRDLENERRMPAGFLRLETLTLEAKKGGRG
jgi:predicted SAM-dependent methyltransferase